MPTGPRDDSRDVPPRRVRGGQTRSPSRLDAMRARVARSSRSTRSVSPRVAPPTRLDRAAGRPVRATARVGSFKETFKCSTARLGCAQNSTRADSKSRVHVGMRKRSKRMRFSLTRPERPALRRERSASDPTRTPLTRHSPRSRRSPRASRAPSRPRTFVRTAPRVELPRRHPRKYFTVSSPARHPPAAAVATAAARSSSSPARDSPEGETKDARRFFAAFGDARAFRPDVRGAWMAWERVRKSGRGRGERTRARGDDDSLWSRWGTGSSARAPPSSVEALTSRFTAMTLLISPCAREVRIRGRRGQSGDRDGDDPRARRNGGRRRGVQTARDGRKSGNGAHGARGSRRRVPWLQREWTPCQA